MGTAEALARGGVLVVSTVWLVVSIMQMKAVRGSRQRYVLTTWAITLVALVVLLELVVIVINLKQGLYFSAGTRAAVALLYMYLSRHFFHDDNWFNNQYKRLKRGLKNLGERLSHMFSPSPMPVPI